MSCTISTYADGITNDAGGSFLNEIEGVDAGQACCGVALKAVIEYIRTVAASCDVGVSVDAAGAGY